MAYITPPSRAAGYIVTEGDWNQDIRANMQAMFPDAATAAGQIPYSTAADAMAVGALPMGFGGRLTLASGTPVPATDLTSGTVLYWTPYGEYGGYCSLFDGSQWRPFMLSELQIGTATFNAATKMYDVFIDYNGGAPALAATAWTNDTTRGTALTFQNGRYVSAGNAAYNYVGVVRTVGVGTIVDSATQRFVGNYYNQLNKKMYSCPGYVDDNSNTSYSLSGTLWVRLNSASGSKIEFVVPETQSVGLSFVSYSLTGAGGAARFGIGLDSLTNIKCAAQNSIAEASISISGECEEVIAPGYHYAELMGVRSVSNATVYADFARLGADADTPATYIMAEVNL
jgi:hypothetical protein